MSSSPKTIESNSEQSYTPSAGEQPLINAGFQEMASLFGTPRDMYPNQTFAGASPFTQAGLYGMGGNAAQGQMGMINPALQAWQSGIGSTERPDMPGFRDPSQNQYVTNMMDVNAEKSNQNLQDNVLPQIQQGAIQAGGFNNERQGLAQGEAIGRAQQGVDWANSNMLSNAYGQEQQQQQAMMNYNLGAYGQDLGQQRSMMSSAPMLSRMFADPYKTMGQAGAGMEGYQQQAINDAMGRFNFDRNDSESRHASMLGQLGGMRYGTQTGTNASMNPDYQSPLTSALQIGAGIGSIPMTGGGSLAGVAASKLPWLS